MACRLVLLPGLDGTGDLFAPLLQALPLSMQPVVVTYPAGQAMSYEALLEHVQKLLPTDSLTCCLASRLQARWH